MKRIRIIVLIFSSHILWAQSNFNNISKIGISVNDLTKSSEFYETFLQFKASQIADKKISKLEKSFGLSYSKGNSILITGPNSSLELTQFEKYANPFKSKMIVPGPGITHVCFQTPEDKPIYSNAIENGAGKVIFGEKPIDRGHGIKYAYALDLDGNIFEMEQLAKPPFKDDVWVGHVAIATPDIEKTIAFYSKLTGLQPVARKNDIKEAKLDSVAGIHDMIIHGAWFRVGKMGLEIWQFVNPETQIPQRVIPYDEIGYNKISFELLNFEEEIKNIQNRGLEPKVDLINKIALIRDIDGNLIELIGI